MRGVVGKVHLLVTQITSPAVQSVVGARNHRQIVRIGRVEQGVKIGEAGALRGKSREIRILHGTLVIRVLKHDDDNSVEMVGLGTGGSTSRFFLLPCLRLRDLLPCRVIGCGSDALGDGRITRACEQDYSCMYDS